MNEYGVVEERATIRFERMLQGPIERVWAYLTESEKRGKWLASGDMDLRVGGRVELKFNHTQITSEPTPEKHKNHMGTQVTEITRCEPPRLLSYTWGKLGDSEVTFELTPRGEQVLLVLTHRRLPNREELLGVAGGWHAHLGLLADLLAGVPPRPFWATHAKLDAEYQTRIAAD